MPSKSCWRLRMICKGSLLTFRERHGQSALCIYWMERTIWPRCPHTRFPMEVNSHYFFQKWKKHIFPILVFCWIGSPLRSTCYVLDFGLSRVILFALRQDFRRSAGVTFFNFLKIVFSKINQIRIRR